MGSGRRSYIACNDLFIEPRGSVTFPHARDVLGIVLYLLTCATLIGFGEAMRRVTAGAGWRRVSRRGCGCSG